MSRSPHYTGFLSSAELNSGAGLAAIPMRTSNKKIQLLHSVTGLRWGDTRERREEDELVDCITLSRWRTVILTVWLTGARAGDWSDPLLPRSAFIGSVNYTLGWLTVPGNGFVKTWFQIMALLRHTARKPYCHHKFYTIIYKKHHH